MTSIATRPKITGTLSKLYRAEVKAVNEDKGTVTAIVSTEKPDRDGDIIRVEGWDLKNFEEHPVLLSSHNYRSLLNQIGEWTEMAVKDKRLVGTAQYLIGKGNDEADWAFELAKMGRAAYSVGFIPDMEKAEKIEGTDDWWPSWEFKGQELLEVSQVTIPANPDALQRAKGLLHHPILDELVDEALTEAGGVDVVVRVVTDSDMDELAKEIAERIIKGYTDVILVPNRNANALPTEIEPAVKRTIKELTESWSQR